MVLPPEDPTQVQPVMSHGHDAHHDAHAVVKGSSGAPAGLKQTTSYSLGSPLIMDVKKGLWFGGIFAAGASLMHGYKSERAAVPKNLFVNPDAVWNNATKYFKTGAPAIVGTLTGFLVVRGTFERSSPEWNLTYKNLLVPLAITSLPSVGYYLATKKTPPEAASVGLILCVLHHTYDRMLALQHYAGWRGKPY